MDSLEESLTDNDKVEEVLRRTGGTTAATDDPHLGFAVFIRGQHDPQDDVYSWRERGGGNGMFQQ